jgi:hypothetical protein
MPPSVRILFHGIMWPERWLQGDEVLARNKALVGSDSGIILDNRHDILQRCVQQLAVDDDIWVVLSGSGRGDRVLRAAEMSLWVMLIGRFKRCIVRSRGDLIFFFICFAHLEIPATNIITQVACPCYGATLTHPQ